MKKELSQLYNEFVFDWLQEREMPVNPTTIVIARKMTNFQDFMEWIEASQPIPCKIGMQHEGGQEESVK